MWLNQPTNCPHSKLNKKMHKIITIAVIEDYNFREVPCHNVRSTNVTIALFPVEIGPLLQNVAVASD